MRGILGWGTHIPYRRLDRSTIAAVAVALKSFQAPMPPGGCEASVVTMAIAMPTMPNRLPCRLVSGFDSPRSARMKRTPATR